MAPGFGQWFCESPPRGQMRRPGCNCSGPPGTPHHRNGRQNHRIVRKQAAAWPFPSRHHLQQSGRKYRTFLSFCCKRVQVMEGERFIISDKWEGTESVVEGFSPKNPDLPWRRPRCNIAKFVLV